MRQKVHPREKDRLQRKKRIRYIISIFILVGLLGLGIVKGYEYLLQSSYLILQEIKIQGTDLVSAEDIFQWCGFRPGENILKIDLGRIKRKLQVLPQIKKVLIQRNFPHQIEIKIEERIPIGLIKDSNEIYAFDSEGASFPYDFSESTTTILPLVTGIAQTRMRKKEQLIKLGDIIDKVNVFGLFEKQQIIINVANSQNPIIQTEEFGQIRLGQIPLDTLQTKLSHLARVITDLKKKGQNTEYIDLQFFENSRDSIYVHPVR